MDEVKRSRGDRGKNNKKYHYSVVNNETNEKEYFFTLQDICNRYTISRSTANNMLMGKVVKFNQFNNITIERDCKPVVQVELKISEEDMVKYLPELL